MKKQNLIKLIIGSTSVLSLSASVISCGHSTSNDPYMAHSNLTVIKKDLMTELKTFNIITNPKIDHLRVTKNKHLATGFISFTNTITSLAPAQNFYNKMPFAVLVNNDNKAKTWQTSDINGLLNPKDVKQNIGLDLAYNSPDWNVTNLLPAGKDADLSISNKNDRVNKTTIKTTIDNKTGILSVSYQGHASTTAWTDGLRRSAYTYNWNQTYNVYNGQAIAKPTISNIGASLTEATKQAQNLLLNFDPRTMPLVQGAQTQQLTNDPFVIKKTNRWTITKGIYKNFVIYLNNDNSKWLSSGTGTITPGKTPTVKNITKSLIDEVNELKMFSNVKVDVTDYNGTVRQDKKVQLTISGHISYKNNLTNRNLNNLAFTNLVVTKTPNTNIWTTANLSTLLDLKSLSQDLAYNGKTIKQNQLPTNSQGYDKNIHLISGAGRVQKNSIHYTFQKNILNIKYTGIVYTKSNNLKKSYVAYVYDWEKSYDITSATKENTAPCKITKIRAKVREAQIVAQSWKMNPNNAPLKPYIYDNDSDSWRIGNTDNIVSFSYKGNNWHIYGIK